MIHETTLPEHTAYAHTHTNTHIWQSAMPQNPKSSIYIRAELSHSLFAFAFAIWIQEIGDKNKNNRKKILPALVPFVTMPKSAPLSRYKIVFVFPNKFPKWNLTFWQIVRFSRRSRHARKQHQYRYLVFGDWQRQGVVWHTLMHTNNTYFIHKRFRIAKTNFMRSISFSLFQTQYKKKFGRSARPRLSERKW